MVFFVCETCNETLKKNQVEKHVYSCRCNAVTCVDCSVTFYGDDYAAHTSCISEQEKYEKSMYKPKAGSQKAKPQDIWTSLIEDIASKHAEAPYSVQPFLERLATLSNVPRNQKKFMNFARNSLNIRKDSILEELWHFLDKLRVKKEGEQQHVSSSSSAAIGNGNNNGKDKQKDQIKEVIETGDEKKKDKKEKKKRLREEEEEAQPIIGEAAAADNDDGDNESKKKKKKKQKKDKKIEEKEEAAGEVADAHVIDCKEEDNTKKEKKNKDKKKKDKKEKAANLEE